MGLPTVNQFYDIPPEFSLNQYDYHDRALYSMWKHFIDFCIKTNKPEWMMNECGISTFAEQTYVDSPFSMEMTPHQAIEEDSKTIVNKFIPKIKRLPIFVNLSTMNDDNKMKQQKIIPDAFQFHDNKSFSNLSPRTIHFEDSFDPEEYLPRDLDSIFFSDQFP